MKTGKGYCDYMFIPKKNGKPAIVMELKVDEDCYAALEQIKEKNYLQRAKEYADNVILVGIGYEKKEKKHTCVIEG
jgi:hypothetical protein